MSATEKPRATLVLRRATAENGLFAEVMTEWAQHVRDAGEDPDEYFTGSMLDHARSIAAETKVDPKYGIFVLENGEGTPRFEGMVHVNHMLPRTSEATVRLVWTILAPKYDFEFSGLDLVRIGGGFIVGGIRLCGAEMKARQLKMYLANYADKSFASGFVAAMQSIASGPDSVKVSVRGNWLHMEDIGSV